METTKILQTGIVFMLGQAWSHYYVDVDSNCKAIIEHGWEPLNHSVLHHTDILQTKKSVIPTTSTTSTNSTGVSTTTTTTSSSSSSSNASVDDEDM